MCLGSDFVVSLRFVPVFGFGRFEEVIFLGGRVLEEVGLEGGGGVEVDDVGEAFFFWVPLYFFLFLFLAMSWFGADVRHRTHRLKKRGTWRRLRKALHRLELPPLFLRNVGVGLLALLMLFLMWPDFGTEKKEVDERIYRQGGSRSAGGVTEHRARWRPTEEDGEKKGASVEDLGSEVPSRDDRAIAEEERQSDGGPGRNNSRAELVSGSPPLRTSQADEPSGVDMEVRRPVGEEESTQRSSSSSAGPRDVRNKATGQGGDISVANVQNTATDDNLDEANGADVQHETDNSDLIVAHSSTVDKFRGVELGMVNGVNITKVSFMVFRIIKTYNITSLLDVPCTATYQWMPAVLERLDYEVSIFSSPVNARAISRCSSMSTAHLFLRLSCVLGVLCPCSRWHYPKN